jgi:hypothetical protein
MMTWTIEALSSIVGRNLVVKVPIRPAIQITHTTYKVCEITRSGEFTIHGVVTPVQIDMLYPKHIQKIMDEEPQPSVKNPS